MVFVALDNLAANHKGIGQNNTENKQTPRDSLCATFNLEDICDVTRFRQTQTHKGDSRRRAQNNVDTSIDHSVFFPTNVHECNRLVALRRRDEVL